MRGPKAACSEASAMSSATDSGAGTFEFCRIKLIKCSSIFFFPKSTSWRTRLSSGESGLFWEKNTTAFWTSPKASIYLPRSPLIKDNFMKIFRKYSFLKIDFNSPWKLFWNSRNRIWKLFLELLLQSNLFDALPRDGIPQRYQSNQGHFQYYLGVFVNLKVKIGTLKLFSWA